MLKVFKEPVKVLTPDGYKIAYGIRKIKKESLKVSFSQNSFITASLNHKFVENDKTTKTYELNIGDLLQGREITNIENVGEIDVYDLTDVDGRLYYTNDLVSHNCSFLGSSETLISPEALREIENRLGDYGDEHVLSSNILDGLEVYKYVEPDHNYIISVDPSKDGIDAFSINVIDISQFPFEQVATADLQIDYLVMPEHLDELGRYYNNALIIIENNEGAGQSIADTLWSIYEYPNMYRDKKGQGQIGFKKFTGFRTTSSSRKVILNLLKIFVDEGKLIINSRITLQQFYTFTKRKTGNKYEAEDGYFDDMVMSLAIMFAPFTMNKQFDDYKMFIKELKLEKSEIPIVDFLSVLDVGFTTDDDEEENSIAARFEASRQMLASTGQTDYAPAEEI